VSEINAGQIDASLGAGLVKKRVPRAGEGKRGGRRVILAFRGKDRSIFLFGFSKNERSNLDEDELTLYKKLAHLYLSIDMELLREMCLKGRLLEVER
jgi:hypothetical protein